MSDQLRGNDDSNDSTESVQQQPGVRSELAGIVELLESIRDVLVTIADHFDPPVVRSGFDLTDEQRADNAAAARAVFDVPTGDRPVWGGDVPAEVEQPDTPAGSFVVGRHSFAPRECAGCARIQGDFSARPAVVGYVRHPGYDAHAAGG